jgi:hypothetical protein
MFQVHTGTRRGACYSRATRHVHAANSAVHDVPASDLTRTAPSRCAGSCCVRCISKTPAPLHQKRRWGSPALLVNLGARRRPRSMLCKRLRRSRTCPRLRGPRQRSPLTLCRTKSAAATWQCGARALSLTHARTHARKETRTQTPTHAPTHPRTHAHTHTHSLSYTVAPIIHLGGPGIEGMVLPTSAL